MFNPFLKENRHLGFFLTLIKNFSTKNFLFVLSSLRIKVFFCSINWIFLRFQLFLVFYVLVDINTFNKRFRIDFKNILSLKILWFENFYIQSYCSTFCSNENVALETLLFLRRQLHIKFGIANGLKFQKNQNKQNLILFQKQ